MLRSAIGFVLCALFAPLAPSATRAAADPVDLLRACQPAAGRHSDADAEDKAAAYVVKRGGGVWRDEKAPGKPVVEIWFRSGERGRAGVGTLFAA